MKILINKNHWHVLILAFFLCWMPFICYAQNDPGSDEEVIKLADELFKNAEYSRAMPLYSQLLSLHPKDPFYSYRFGVSMLYTDRSDPEKPLRFIEKGTGQLGGEDARMIYFHLGVAYHQAYRFGEAIKAFKGFIKVNSAYDPLLTKESELRIQMCKNGIELLSNVKDLFVLQKSEVLFQNFFRSYDLKHFGGNLLGKPDFLKTKLDKKLGDFSIVFFSDTHRVVYYSSYGKKNTNGKDIFRVRKNANDEWGEPERLSNVINTPYDEDFPYLLPDGRTLYFCSKGHNSMGGYDIFKSVFDSVRGEWSRPINVDFAINSPFDDILFITDPDQRFAYFSSTRNSEEGQIMVYKVRIDRRPDDSFNYDPEMLSAESIELGDSMYLLTIEQIRHNASLDVNANEDMFPDSNVVVATNNVSDNARYNIPENPTEQDVVDLAFSHVGDAESEMFRLRNLRDAALLLADGRKQDSERFRNEADETFDKANDALDPSVRQTLFAQATELSKQSENSNEEYEMARTMYLQYAEAADQQSSKFNSMQDRAGRIQQLAGSRQIDTSVVLLKKLIDDIDTFKIEIASIVHRINNGGNDPDAMQDQQNLLVSESANLINEANRLNQEAVQYRNEAALVQDPELKQEYLDEAHSLDSLANIKRIVSREKSDQANQIQQQLSSIEEQNQIQTSISEQIASIANGNPVYANNDVVQNQDSTNSSNSAQSNNDIANNSNNNSSNDNNSNQQNINTNNSTSINNNQDSTANNGQNNNISYNNQQLTNDSSQQNYSGNSNTHGEIANSIIDSIKQYTLAAEQKSNAIQGLLNQKLLTLKEKEDAISRRLEENSDISEVEIQTLNSAYSDILQQVIMLDQLNELYRSRFDSLQNLLIAADVLYSQTNSQTDSIQWNNTNARLNQILDSTKSLQLNEIYTPNEQATESIVDQISKLNEDAVNLGRQEKKYESALSKAEQRLADAKTEKRKEQAKVEIDNARANLDSIQALIANNRNEQISLSERRNSLEKMNLLTLELQSRINSFTEIEFNTAIAKSTNFQPDLYNRYLAGREDQSSAFSTDYVAPILQESYAIASSSNPSNNNNSNNSSNVNDNSNQQINSNISDSGNDLIAFTDDRGANNTSQPANISESNIENNQSRFYEYAANSIIIRIQSTRKQLETAQTEEKDSLQRELSNLQNRFNELITESEFYAENAINLAKLNGETIPNDSPIYSPEYIASGFMEQYLQGMQQADSIRERAVLSSNSNDSINVIQRSNEVENAAWNRYLNALEVYGIWNEALYNRSESIILQALREGKGPLSSRNAQLLDIARKKFADARALRTKSKSLSSIKDKIPLNEKALELEKQSLADLTTVINELLGTENSANYYSEIILETETESNLSIDSVAFFELKNQNDSNNLASANNNNLDVNNTGTNSSNNAITNSTNDAQQNQNVTDGNQNNQNNNNQTASSNSQNNDIIVNNTNTVNSNSTSLNNSIDRSGDSLKNNRITLIDPGSPNYTSFYNDSRPIKIEEAIQTGLYYRVQIAASRKMVSPSTFKGIDPITAESGQGWIRYMAGFFTRFNDGKAARDKIRPMGYADAFVVAYYNGKRISIAEARELEVGGALASNPNEATNSTITSATNNQSASNQTINVAGINEVASLTYSVQVGVYGKPRTSASLFGITSLIEERLPNGYYRYFSGSFSNIEDATIAQNTIRKKGVPDAFVVILYNGKKINKAEANTLVNNGINFKGIEIGQEKGDSQGTANQSDNSVLTQAANVVFKIQIGAYSKDVPVDMVNKLIELSENGVEKYLDENGMTIYTTGNYQSYKAAMNSREQIVANGLNDAFIIAFSNGKKIPMTESLKNQNP